MNRAAGAVAVGGCSAAGAPVRLNAAGHAELMARHGAGAAYEVALSLLQQMGTTTAHVGGRSSFQLRGCGQYAEYHAVRRLLFGQPGEPMPAFLSDYDWGIELVYLTPPLLPPDAGLIEYGGGAAGDAPVRVSGNVRALLEALAVVPECQHLQEAQEILDLQEWLEPAEVQSLLESCQDARAVRTFLHLAEQSELPWVQELALDRIDLGEGVLELGVEGMEAASGGAYADLLEDHLLRKELCAKYRIWLPKGIGQNESIGL